MTDETGRNTLIADHYDELSHDYEAWYTLGWPEPVHHHRQAFQKIFKNKGLSGSLRILDLTCGIGTQSLALAMDGHRVTAIDLSAGQLAKARENEKSFSISHPVTWIQGDAAHPARYAESEFDVILSFGTSLPLLGSEAAIAQSMQEAKSLLAKNGLLLISMIDHTQLRETKPYLLESGILNHNGKSGVYTETANWLEDGRRYESHIIFVWTSPEHRQAHYPFPPLAALTRDEFILILEKSDFSDIEFSPAQESDFTYPLFSARG